MNHVGKTSFPEPLLQYYKTHELDSKKELKSFFKNNKLARKEFIAWSSRQESIVSEAPRLYAAAIIAKKLHSKSSLSAKITSLYGSRTQKAPTPSDQKPFENYSKTNVATALSLHHLNLINEEQFSILFNEKKYYSKFNQNKLYDILSSDTHTPGKKPIFNEKIITALLPYLEKLVGKHLLQQLSVVNDDKQTPLFNLDILRSLIPLLKARNISLTLLSKQDNQGDTPLHFYDLFKEIMPILNTNAWKFSYRTFIDALTKKNIDGYTPLHSPEIMEMSIPILEYYISKNDFGSIFTLLSRKDSCGKTPLHFGDVYAKAIRILRKLNPELNFKLHSIQDNYGNIPLHQEDIMSMAVKCLPLSMFIDSAKELLTIKNLKGDTPLHLPMTLKNSHELLMRLSQDDLEMIISVEDKRAITVRQIIYDENLAFPLLNKILFNKLTERAHPDNSQDIIVT